LERDADVLERNVDVWERDTGVWGRDAARHVATKTEGSPSAGYTVCHKAIGEGDYQRERH